METKNNQKHPTQTPCNAIHPSHLSPFNLGNTKLGAPTDNLADFWKKQACRLHHHWMVMKKSPSTERAGCWEERGKDFPLNLCVNLSFKFRNYVFLWASLSPSTLHKFMINFFVKNVVLGNWFLKNQLMVEVVMISYKVVGWGLSRWTWGILPLAHIYTDTLLRTFQSSVFSV